MMPVCLCEIVERMVAGIHGACGDLVKQRLPEMGACPVDEGHLRLAPSAEGVAEARDEFEPAGSPADDDDPGRRFGYRDVFLQDRFHSSLVSIREERLRAPAVLVTAARQRS